MSWRRGKTQSTGWAVFDLKQRGKQAGLEPLADVEPFPALISSIATPNNTIKLTEKKNDLNGPSGLIQTVDLPTLMVNNKDITTRTRLHLFDDSASHTSIKNNEELIVLQAAERLVEDYPWAERSLVEDVLAGVNSNIGEASSILKVMESSGGNKCEAQELKFSSGQGGHINENMSLGSEGVTSQIIVDFANLKCVIEADGKHKSKELLDDHDFLGNKLLSDGADNDMNLGNVKSYPIEPEYEEEDDIYHLHRKDAIRKMRSAAHHSTAAQDAYVRGDHLSAQHHSQKAREEWIAAQRLNAKAAKEIFNIRNTKNDLWTLDLHGLHAAEAIQALQERLRKIEYLVSFNHVASATTSIPAPLYPPSVSLDSSSSCEGMKGNGLPSSSQRSLNLQVITGKGNHSRGEPALAASVRSFLIENRYHYDEARPGVITVRPKFRRRMDSGKQ